MDKHYYEIVNSIYISLYEKELPYDKFINLMNRFNIKIIPSNISRLKEYLINQSQQELLSKNIFMLNDDTLNTHLNLDVKTQTLLVLSIFSNIEKNFIYISKFIDDLTSKFKEIDYYILTNNNTDKTEELLKEYIKTRPYVHCLFEEDCTNYTFFGHKNIYLAKLRNQCYINSKKNATNIDKYDYLVILDSNITSYIDINSFISSFSLEEKWDIICANRTFKKSYFNQDVYSLRLLDDSLDITQKFTMIEKYYDKTQLWINKFYAFNTWHKVQSGFGGLMIIDKKVFKLSLLWNENLSKYESEHVSLCTKFKNIYINPYLNFESNICVEGILYFNPYIFIPRDAGFFSVLNYLIGSIKTGSRIYPYYNKQKILEKNKSLDHFCYLDNSVENSWFSYFESIEYYADDTTHNSDAILIFNNTQGELASNEFKIPNETYKLYNSPDFKLWRIEMNKYYKKFIKPKKNILDRVELQVSEFNTDIIAVLYRHPAHMCESSKIILFEDYFKKIDELLDITPEAQIYLSTDTDLAIGSFTLKYADKLLYDKSCGRSSIDNIIKWAFARNQNAKINDIGFINNIGYEYHNECVKNNIDQIKHAEDIIANTLIMSRCKWFIYPESNISLAISYINPEIEMIPV
jgi:hypothetical protein